MTPLSTRYLPLLKQTLRATSIAILLAPTLPAPASAGLLSCFFGGCFGTGGSSGGSTSGGGTSTPTAAETGIIHVVFVVGDSFFPTQIHAAAGDRIKFYNLTNGSVRIRATDSSWNTGYLDRNQQYSFVLQQSTTRTFQKQSYNTQMTGAISLASAPASVSFGDLIDYEGYIVGKDGSAVQPAEGLGYTLASLGGTLRLVGNGLAKGLTSTFGGGNN